jgi:AcrR family transcriptional regulator
VLDTLAGRAIARSPVAKTALEKAREAPGSTKARILAAAEAVFAEKGFQGASTREIAGRAAVNISSLHYHWESK